MTRPRMRYAFVRAAAAGVVLATLAAGAWYGYERVASAGVTRVVFTGSLQRIAPADLEALSRSLRAAAGRTSLAAARDAARRIAWVRDADVRRRFPDTLEIRFDTHEPLAYWNDDALLSTRGEVFNAPFEGAAPRFRGADGTGPVFAREYARFARGMEPLGSPIAELRLSARGAWQASLESGLVLELGRSDTDARMARLASAWPELVERGMTPKHADLRYANGFAVTRTAPPPRERARQRT